MTLVEHKPTAWRFSEAALRSMLPPSCGKFYYNKLDGNRTAGMGGEDKNPSLEDRAAGPEH